MSNRDYRSIYVFLALQVTFFIFQVQSSSRFVEAFALTRESILRGEVWRLISFQFVTSPAFGSPAIGLFFTLLIFYIFGGAIEEAWGTAHFLAIFALSTAASAAFGIVTGIPLLGGFFFEYVMLFIFAHMHPNHVFYLMLILPLKVKWIAAFAGVILLLGLLQGDRSAIAGAIGAVSGFSYYLAISRPDLFRNRRPPIAADRKGFTRSKEGGLDADRNLETYRAIGEAIERGNADEAKGAIDRLRSHVVPGVNICPPVDYKPEAEDRYCIQCEGFNECTIRNTEVKLRELEEKETSVQQA